MAFTVAELENINNAALEEFLDKGTVFKQNVQNKPLLQKLNQRAGKFSGGNEFVSLGVSSGQGGGTLQGFTHDDTVSYYNPTGIKRAKYPWKEHHIGIGVSITEFKYNGIEIVESGATQSEVTIDGAEEHRLANLTEEKHENLAEDYAKSLNLLLHGDGSTDTKALAGIRSLILDDPSAGSTGSLSRANLWWRNRAATTAADAAGSGFAPIVSNTAGGGALIQFLQKEKRQISRYARAPRVPFRIAGSDFIDAYEKELRANGNYSQTGFKGDGAVDGAMADIKFDGIPFVYDPTLDDLGYSKRMFDLDLSRRGIRLLYLNGKRMQKHNPARPYDRYVTYNGLTMTGVLVARQLNTSAVYDIA